MIAPVLLYMWNTVRGHLDNLRTHFVLNIRPICDDDEVEEVEDLIDDGEVVPESDDEC